MGTLLAAAQPKLPHSLTLAIDATIARLHERGCPEDFTWIAQARDGGIVAELLDGVTWSQHVCGGARFDAPPGAIAWIVIVRGDGNAHHLLQIPDGAAAYFTRRKGINMNTGGRATFATIVGAKNGDDGRYWFFAPGGLLTVSDDLNAVAG